MQYYTLVSKSIHCPFWNIDLAITGKYRYTDKPYEAKFINGICPIIENNKLSAHKRDKELVLYAFCDYYTCEELNSFKPTIDITKDDYSQS